MNPATPFHSASAVRLLLLLFPCLLLATAQAEIPKKAPLMKYTHLWSDSPFTSKPPPTEAGPISNPLEDFSLAGVSPIGSGYRVTLLNKKKPEERIFIFTDEPNAKHGFKILGVDRKPGDSMGTVVRLTSGTLTGSVSYDEKLLTLAAAPAAKPKVPGQPGQPGQPNIRPPVPGQPQPVPNAGNIPQRQPRPRVVAPPAPQVQPAPAVPNNPNTQRPIRR